MTVEAKKQTVATTATPASVNTEVDKAKQIGFNTLIKSKSVQDALMGTLGDAMHVKTFTSSIISAVSTNRDLQKCDGMSIISAALLGESLKLSPSPQLGQYYMVPFNNGKTGTKVATFQLGWKGYYQLALRSGQYKALEVTPVKEGELISYNPFTGECELEPLNDAERENAKTIGYYAYFELTNGFRKELYWPREQMEEHAKTYSKGYASDLRKHTSYTFWTKNFDAMAKKTLIRQLISKWGIMSVEMQKAYEADMGVLDEDGTVRYVDNEQDIVTEVEAEIAENSNKEEFVVEEPAQIEEKPDPKTVSDVTAGVKEKDAVDKDTNSRDKEKKEEGFEYPPFMKENLQ